MWNAGTWNYLLTRRYVMSERYLASVKIWVLLRWWNLCRAAKGGSMFTKSINSEFEEEKIAFEMP